MVVSGLASPTTVARVPGPIVGVAQNGGSVAWLTASPSGCKLTIRSGGPDRATRYAPGCSPLPQDLALAGGVAAWGGYQEVRCSEMYAEVRTGSTTAAHLVQNIPGDCLGFDTS